jgi:CheY-like chemotaxis protein
MARILIIDDNEAVRGLLALMLRRMGHQVVPVGDGETGLALFRAHPFDLLFTDWLMPTMSGFEVITQTRALSREVGIVAVSGRVGLDSDHAWRQVRAMGDLRILRKPFSSAMLRETVEQLMAKRTQVPSALETSSRLHEVGAVAPSLTMESTPRRENKQQLSARLWVIELRLGTPEERSDDLAEVRNIAHQLNDLITEETLRDSLLADADRQVDMARKKA